MKGPLSAIAYSKEGEGVLTGFNYQGFATGLQAHEPQDTQQEHCLECASHATGCKQRKRLEARSDATKWQLPAPRAPSGVTDGQPNSQPRAGAHDTRTTVQANAQ